MLLSLPVFSTYNLSQDAHRYRHVYITNSLWREKKKSKCEDGMWQPRKRVGRAALPISELSRVCCLCALPDHVTFFNASASRVNLSPDLTLFVLHRSPPTHRRPPSFPHDCPFPFPSQVPLLVAPQSLRPKTRRSPIPRWPTSHPRPPRKDPAPRSTRRPRPTASLLGKGFTIYRLIQTTFRMFLYLLLP